MVNVHSVSLFCDWELAQVEGGELQMQYVILHKMACKGIVVLELCAESLRQSHL